MATKTFRADDDEVVSDGGSKTNETIKYLSRMLTCMPNIRATGEPNFETDISGHAIGGVLSLLNLDSDALLKNLNLNKSDFG